MRTIMVLWRLDLDVDGPVAWISEMLEEGGLWLYLQKKKKKKELHLKWF